MEINEFIQNYGILESKACKSKSNLEVSAFTPVAFQNNGFKRTLNPKISYINTLTPCTWADSLKIVFIGGGSNNS